MKDFMYYCPTEIVFGKDSETKIGRCVHKYGGNRVFLVYGGASALKSGLIERLSRELEEEEIAYELFGGVKPNPTVDHAREGIRRAVAFQADMILGVGGGSVIDTAKAIAHGAANAEWDIWEIWTGKRRLRNSLPIGTVLTIPAAGSEMSDSAVLTEEKLAKKRGLSTEWNRPKFSILNPELCLTLSSYQVACGVSDILMHTMERYFKREKNVLTEALAEALLMTVIGQGRIAVKQPSDYDAMSELMWAGSLSHNGLTGLGGVGDWACHKLGHELSAMFDLAHGASLTAIWGAWAYYVYKDYMEPFICYAQRVWGIQQSGEEAALGGIEATISYFREIGMPTTLVEAVGVQDETVIKKLSLSCSQNGEIVIGKMKELGEADIFQIYKNANIES